MQEQSQYWSLFCTFVNGVGWRVVRADPEQSYKQIAVLYGVHSTGGVHQKVLRIPFRSRVRPGQFLNPARLVIQLVRELIADSEDTDHFYVTSQTVWDDGAVTEYPPVVYLRASMSVTTQVQRATLH